MAQPAGNLSIKSLELLPRRDSKAFIVTYMKEQKAFASAYAADGHKYWSTWDTSTFSSPLPPVSGTPTRNNPPVDFDTPVLKARVVDQRAQHSPPTVVHTSKSVRQPRLPQKEGGLKRHKGSEAVRKKPAGKRQRALSNPSIDEKSEHALRLKERRDKKRAKRAIMRPAGDETSDASSRSGVQAKNAKRKGKKTKAKNKEEPSGFSLMYGFMATNVGSRRLTTKPAVCAGVFNKGKASSKTITPAFKKKSKAGAVKNATEFSESDFLNHQEPPAALKEEDLSASGESSRVDLQTNKQENKKQSRPIVPKTRTARNLTARKGPASSVVWDIERDDFVLPSEPGDAIRTQPNQDVPGGTVPSDLHSAVIQCTFDNPCDELSTLQPDRKPAPSVTSIHPSESASQVELALSNHAQGNFSRYFNETDKPRQTIADPDVQQAASQQILVEEHINLSPSQPNARNEGPVDTAEYAISFQEPLSCPESNELLFRDYGFPSDGLEGWVELHPSALYAEELAKQCRKDPDSWMHQDTFSDDVYPMPTDDPPLWYLPSADDLLPGNPGYDASLALMHEDNVEFSDGPLCELSHPNTYDYQDDEPLPELEDQSNIQSGYNYALDGYLPSENAAPAVNDGASSSHSSLARFVLTDEPLSDQSPTFPQEDVLLHRASTSLQRAELNVACRLKNHWQPQRF